MLTGPDVPSNASHAQTKSEAFNTKTDKSAKTS